MEGVVDGSFRLGEAPELHQADRDLDRELRLPIEILRAGARPLEQVDPRCEVGPIERPDTRSRQVPGRATTQFAAIDEPSSASSRLDCSRW